MLVAATFNKYSSSQLKQIMLSRRAEHLMNHSDMQEKAVLTRIRQLYRIMFNRNTKQFATHSRFSTDGCLMVLIKIMLGHEQRKENNEMRESLVLSFNFKRNRATNKEEKNRYEKLCDRERAKSE